MSLLLEDTPTDLKMKFFSLATPHDVADMLDVKYRDLIYYLYRLNSYDQYKIFYIPKKNGSFRQINAPISPIKIIQKKLSQVFNAVYEIKEPTHGFVEGKNILTNASVHIKRRYVFNIDLEDFFPSINFGRVRGLLNKMPFNLNEDVATILAQICCYNGILPQGAPTSPIVTNMICSKLDRNLSYLAYKNKCIYTRYADDITFSTSARNFPKALARVDSNLKLEVGEELKKIIKENGFIINNKKVRLQENTQRQEVTGLTVNKFPNTKRNYVRQIRAMLHAWEKFGYEQAQAEYLNKYNKSLNSFNNLPEFKNVVNGKIEFLGFVKGKDNNIYQSFVQKLMQLDPENIKKYKKKIVRTVSNIIPLIYTEGKTDVKYLKCALSKLQQQNKFTNLNVEFYDSENDMGGEELKKLCSTTAKLLNNPQPLIFIFDRDVEKIIGDVSGTDGLPYKDWGNNVYSFVIPIPIHRNDMPYISIEFCFTDEEIKTKDEKGRRLFLSSEFDPKSGRNLKESDLSCLEMKKIKSDKVSIIDNAVFDSKSNNVALSKNDFAESILSGNASFQKFGFESFIEIFAIMSKIIEIHN